MYQYRFDLVLSYWIFAWFLLHWWGWIRSSPKLALWIGLTANLVIISIMWMYHNPHVLWFLAINISIKAIPLYVVRNERIQWRTDTVNFLVLLLLFVAWNAAVGEDIVHNSQLFADSWKTGNITLKNSPGTFLLRDITALRRGN